LAFQLDNGERREGPPRNSRLFSLTMERGALKKQLDIQLDDGKRREVPPRNIWIFRLTVERGERCLQETVGF
jgi:hypothetical protein